LLIRILFTPNGGLLCRMLKVTGQQGRNERLARSGPCSVG
jgi:hypothetical protein